MNQFSRRAGLGIAASAMLACWLSLCFPGSVVAAAKTLQVRFVGMHGSKANVMINRRMHLLKPGQSGNGVTVMMAGKKEAILRIGDVNYRFPKGSDQGVPLSSEVVLARNSGGMFVTEGAVNGKRMYFVVDTGASHVVISGAQARRMKIKYRKSNPVEITTASRVEKAYAVTLESVQIGGIVKINVPGIITKGKQPDVVLLGMSFLRGLDIRQTEGFMRLRD